MSLGRFTRCPSKIPSSSIPVMVFVEEPQAVQRVVARRGSGRTRGTLSHSNSRRCARIETLVPLGIRLDELSAFRYTLRVFPGHWQQSYEAGASGAFQDRYRRKSVPRIGLPELLILLAIVFFLFGAKRLPEMGRGIGEGIRNFRKSVKSDDGEDSGEQPKPKET